MASLEDRFGALTVSEWKQYREITDRFESAWLSGPEDPPNPEAFLPDPRIEPLTGLVLLRNVKVDLEFRADRGVLPSPDLVLGRHATIAEDREALVEILAWASRLEDLAVGSRPSGFDLPSLVERFPHLKNAIITRRATLYRDLDGKLPADFVPEGYTLIHELKHGGMGRVVLVWNEAARRQEVLKINDPRSVNRPDAVARFLREIELAGNLAIGQVVPVYQAGSLGDHLYYTMPFFRGGSLRDRLEAGTLSLREGVSVLLEVTRAVHKLHTHQTEGRSTPIVHRDLKPGNILFPDPGPLGARIADLGLAKLLDDSAASAFEFATLTGESLGTPGYMAPEQIRETIGPVGPSTDVYALGAILYELLTGKRPAVGSTPYEMALSTVHDVPVSPREIVPKPAIKPLSAVAMKALEKVPSHRYLTAEAMADELDRWLEGFPVLASEPGLGEKLWSAARRYPWVATLAAAFVVVLIAGTTISTVLYLGVREQKARADRNALRRVSTLGELSERIHKGLTLAGMTSLRDDLFRTTSQSLDEVVRENEGIGSIELGNTLIEQSKVCFLLGRSKDAFEIAERAFRVFDGLPPTFEARTGKAIALQQAGRLLHALSRPQEGEPMTERSLELFRVLSAERPEDLAIRFRLALALTNLGNYSMYKDSPRAIEFYGMALKEFDYLRRQSHDAPLYVEWDARIQSNLGLVLLLQGRIDEGLTLQTQAIEMTRQVIAALPGEFGVLDLLATTENNLADALSKAGRLAESEAAFVAALDAYRTLNRRFPEETEFAWGIAMVQTSRAALLARQGRWDEGAIPLLEAGKGFEALQNRLAKNPEFLENVKTHRKLSEQFLARSLTPR